MSFVADQDLLMEDEADKQRIVEEQQLAEYIAAIKQERAAADRVREEQEHAERAKRREEYRKLLVRDLKDLGLEVPLERVRIEETGDFGEWYPAVEFGGVTFALRYANSQYHVSYKVHIAQPCIRCGAPVWESVAYPSDLAYELERKDHAHDFNCVETRDDDDDDDDEGGWPAAAAAPKAPTLTERYTAAIKRRRELQFERAKEKEFATRRILANKGVTFNGESFVAGSATAAEKLVEFDEGYAAACAALTEAVIAEIGAREALRAAGGNPSKEDEES